MSQAANDAQRMVAAVLTRRIDGQRQDDLRFGRSGGLRPSYFAERPRHDADDLIPLAVERNRTPDHLAVTAKPAAPQRFAEHHDSRSATLFVFAEQRPAHDRLHGEDVEERRGHEAGVQQLGISSVR